MARKYLAVDTSVPDYSLIEGTFFNRFDCYTEFVKAIERVIPNLFEYKILSQRNGQSPRREVLIECKFKNENYSTTPFYFYVCPLEGGGRYENEQRIQFNPSNRWTPNLSTLNKAHQFLANEDKTGLEIYVLGIYKTSENDDNIIFSGMYPSSIETTETNNNKTSTSSVQVRIDSIQRAYQTGIDFENTNAGPIINFTPNNIFWYMINRDQLHLADLEKISEIINSRRKTLSSKPNINIKEVRNILFQDYLRAMRTKPFLLLAGISGTGKSRIVRKLAQATITKKLQETADNTSYTEEEFEQKRWNLHRPANFELIQVKPNWHNSMDVVGYLSNIPSPHYVFTPFINFIVKAWQNPDVPFFVCLDEMNLAPVEEYFAEFLSAIESRDFENGAYSTDPIIKPFSEFGIVKDENGNEKEVGSEMINTFFPKVTIGDLVKESKDPTIKLAKQLYNKGLSLPQNLIVIGTVNMDETTFSFSRKVLDRAMSIEMNEVNYGAFLSGKTDDGLKEIVSDIPDLNKKLVDRPIHATNIYDSSDPDANSVIEYLERINALLDGTPFKLGYRAANEALLYLNASGDFGNPYWRSAMDSFTLMKILSRIEGDSNKLKIEEKGADKERLDKSQVEPSRAKQHGDLTILTALRVIIEEALSEPGSSESDKDEITPKAVVETSLEESSVSKEISKPKELESIKKLDSMISQLERERFVSYWN